MSLNGISCNSNLKTPSSGESLSKWTRISSNVNAGCAAAIGITRVREGAGGWKMISAARVRNKGLGDNAI